ncbi:rhomboid family intramembrane serine protease [Halosquirtibacter xylanolyticus]|uniref:rhomboid family intramembrane serine protease n=1 Tax=Halosquirtibacter xylanolyticus TaxID=3374599 RepID=UPI00374A62B9|nr:rhomboid family intramembrane serine protease [Prolixibacteraceae bacterium]
MILSITTLLCITIGIVSYYSFQDMSLFEKLEFNSYKIVHKSEYYRLFTHAFVHGDWNHLIINLLVLYSFGSNVEGFFIGNFGSLGSIYYILLFVLSLPISSIVDLIKYKDNPHYNAVGASGAVSAILFCSIFLNPWGKIYFFAVLPIPGVLFGAGYIYYSYYMGQKNSDNVGHYAHLTGALFGFIYPLFINFNKFLTHFIQQF